MIETLIEQHLKEAGHSYPAGDEVHYVNAYFNKIASQLGVSKRNDPFTSIAESEITLDKLQACKNKVFSMLNPKSLVKTMADSYLDQVKGVQVVDVSSPISVHEHHNDVILRDDAIKSSSLNQEFGEVKLESYVFLSEDYSTMRFSKQSTLIAKQFFEKLKSEDVLIYDDAISLNDDDGEGSIKILGDLFWRDIYTW